jgi:hypothetical protein
VHDPIGDIYIFAGQNCQPKKQADAPEYTVLTI